MAQGSFGVACFFELNIFTSCVVCSDDVFAFYLEKKAYPSRDLG